MPIIDTWDREHRRVIYATWERLPPHVRRALDGVTFTSGRHARKSYASAGSMDVDIRRLPPTTDAAVGVLAHELAHVAARHYERLNAGQITVAEAEAEADRVMEEWRLGRELRERRMAIGR